MNFKVLKNEVIILTVVAIATATNLFLFWAYGGLLDFFPWGDRNAYVIWEPLVLDFIVPSFLAVALLMIVLSKSRSVIVVGAHCLLIGISHMLPIFFDFDLPSDLQGRWTGVIVSVTAVGLLTLDGLKSINRLGQTGRIIDSS
jgi:hypothetical protein